MDNDTKLEAYNEKEDLQREQKFVEYTERYLNDNLME